MSGKTTYREHYDDQARKLCRLGATDKDLADFFEVTEQTINNWKRDFPSFFESLKAGKALSDAEVADKLFKRATGYEHRAVKIFNNQGEIVTEEYIERYPPDTTAAIFWLKNRRPDLWRQAPEAPKGEDDQDIVVTVKRASRD